MNAINKNFNFFFSHSVLQRIVDDGFEIMIQRKGMIFFRMSDRDSAFYGEDIEVLADEYTQWGKGDSAAKYEIKTEEEIKEESSRVKQELARLNDEKEMQKELATYERNMSEVNAISELKHARLVERVIREAMNNINKTVDACTYAENLKKDETQRIAEEVFMRVAVSAREATARLYFIETMIKTLADFFASDCYDTADESSTTLGQFIVYVSECCTEEDRFSIMQEYELAEKLMKSEFDFDLIDKVRAKSVS